MCYDAYHIDRCDAMEFLAVNFAVFPQVMPDIQQDAPGISKPVFRDWRFIYLQTGELVFANCLSECIRASDLY